jgi:membrane protease YdiL (CAAX protease family)
LPVVRQTPPWRWWIHFLVLGTYPLLGLLFRFTTGRVSREPALSGGVQGLLFVSSLELLFFGLFFAVAWLASRASREQLMFTWRPGWWVVPLGIVYSIALRLMLVVAAILVIGLVIATQITTPDQIQSYITTNRPKIESLVSVTAMRNNPAYFWLNLTVVSVVVAGLREEIWRAGTLAAMRALWPRAFGSMFGQCAAVSIIAIAFGLMHLRMGILVAAGAGVLGLLLGFIIVVHKSIWPAVVAHGVFDATTMAFLPWWMDQARHLH